MALQIGGGKLPGKTAYFGRRRAMTRTSGFKVHKETSGGEFERLKVNAYEVPAGGSLALSFTLPAHDAKAFLGFGGWFQSNRAVAVRIENGPARRTLTSFPPPNWNKIGSIWQGGGTAQKPVKVVFTTTAATRIAIHQMQCGLIEHKHMKGARAELLPNMYQFAPEAMFVTKPGTVSIQVNGKAPGAISRWPGVDTEVL